MKPGRSSKVPVNATRFTPSLSVRRPITGRNGSVTSIVVPISANCARDQPKSAIRCGAKTLLV
jgi:hypothetical protein